MKKTLGRVATFLSFGFLLASVSHAVPAFTRESGVRLSSAMPQAVLLSTPSYYRMYFIRDYAVYSASSTDQIDWGVEPGIRLSSSVRTVEGGTYPINGCDLMPLNGGGYRMLYSVGNGTGPYGIAIATSADGMGFGSPTVSTAIYGGPIQISSPKLVEHSTGEWFMFFVGNSSVFVMSSVDQGATWNGLSGLTSGVGDLELSTRTDGRVRIWLTTPLTGSTTNSTLTSALSNSGITAFSPESGLRFSTNAAEGGLFNPVVARSTESYRYRLFYNFRTVGSTITPDVFSALTLEPDPQAISPGTINNTDSAQTFTVTGEIFASTPSVVVTRTGETDLVGTSESPINDQTMTVTLNPFGADLGVWNVELTNPDGAVGILIGGLTISFAEGSVVATDNVLRPRLGNETQFAVSVFNSGHILARLYSMDGKFVKKLFDQDVSVGTTVFNWDGTNDSGEPVASGTYVVKFEGPKLEKTEMVVLIR